MSFFPDSIWGLAYLAALIVFGAITWAGPNRAARRILLVLTVHWFFLRLIDAYDHENFRFWIAHDAAVILALLFFCRSIAGRSCAALFIIVLSFDNYSLITGGTFEGASVIAELLGVLAMIFMAGDAHADRGRFWNGYRSLFAGIGDGLSLGKIWRQSRRSAQMPQQVMAADPHGLAPDQPGVIYGRK